MKKQRTYLKDLIPIPINKLVLEDGIFEFPFGDSMLTLVPENYGNKQYLCLFVNNIRQPMQYELYARPHRGRLANGAQIPYRNDAVYYVISNGRRFTKLYIDPETFRIGSRIDHFGSSVHRQYKRGKTSGHHAPSQREIDAMSRQLFEERDPFLRGYKKLLRKSRLGI